MNPDEKMRWAGGELDELPPPPPVDPVARRDSDEDDEND